MTPNEWSRIRALFDEALQHPAQERTSFLDRACRDAPALRTEVEALLSAHEQAEAAGALESPFVPSGATTRDAPVSDADQAQTEVGRRVGPYRLVRPLGRGGMGTVYLAERADGQFRQTVALKLIRRGLDTDDVLARFAFERQILAGLDHPNIARIYDGGVTDDGRPYFAMEYVEGEPITEYCDRRRLSTRERLELFRIVCRAVQHAHRNLVIHRDLKPSNIFVTDTGTENEEPDAPQVKLLDFGIAKLLSDDAVGTGLAMPRTRTGRQVLTPEYAAPEQIRGEPITTATDVYQLGVLLYELLTGRRPYRLTSRMRHAVPQIIVDEEPERPSTAVGRTEERSGGDGTETLTPKRVSQARSTDPTRLQRQLAGDLDVICLKALKTEPERRYDDVDALAEDVHRHLTGRTVTARPDTFGYRASRFVRRHRVGVSAAVLVLLAILTGTGAALWQSRVAAAERDRAEAALAQAEGTLHFLETVIASGGPDEGNPETPIGVVLDSAAARVDTELGDQPRVARAVHTSLAGVFFEMGRLDAAEQAARSALALFGTERGADYGRTAQVLAMTLDYQDAHDESIRYHEDAIEHLTDVPGKEHLLAATFDTYGAVLLETKREDDAQAAYEASLKIYRTLDDPNIVYPLSGLGVLHNYRGQYEQALPYLREVVERLRARHDEPHYVLGEALGNLAGTLSELGRHNEGLPYRREAVDMLVATVGEEHHSTVISRAAFSNELRQVGNVEAAQRAGQRALDAALRAFGPDHSLTAYAQNVAGQAHCLGPDPSAGVALLRRSLDTRRTVLPEGHWLVSNGESLLGDCLARIGAVDEAESLLRRSYEALRDDRGPEHQKTLDARERLRAFEASTVEGP